MGDVRDDLGAVEVGAEAAGGLDHRHAVVVQFLHQVGDELRTLADVFHIEGLVKADGHGLHRTDLHAAVGEEALVERHELHHLVGELLVVGGDDAAAGEAEFAGGEVDDIETVCQHVVDLLGGHELAARLAGLHEVDVVLQQGSVENALDAEFVADVRDGKHVLQAHRLAADEVGAGLHAHEGDLLRTVVLDGLAEGLEVEVALERVIRLRDETLLVHQLDHFAAQAGDVRFGGGEVEIHQRDHARLHVGLREDVLRGAALVGRQDVLRAEDLLDGGLDAVEGLGSGVGIIGDAHRGDLLVGHTVHARVRDHIEIDVLVLEEEGVVSGFLDGLEALFDREQGEFLDDAHFVHLQGDLILRLIEFDCHSMGFLLLCD